MTALFPSPMFDDCACADCRPSAMARILAVLDAAHDAGAWVVLFDSRSPDALHALTVWAGSRNLKLEVTRHREKDGAAYDVWRVEDGAFNCSLHVEVRK